MQATASQPSSIEQLFAEYRDRGRVDALAAVFDATADELARVAGFLAGGDRDRAADLLQSTWLTAMTHAARWDAQRPLLPWLLGVLANHARAQQRERRRFQPAAAALSELLAGDDPVRASQDTEFTRLLVRALAELPTPFREAVTLHVQHGLTAKEIGEALGRPAGTVRTQLVRGLDRLRQLLPRSLAPAVVGGVVLSASAMAQVKAMVLRASRGAPMLPRWRWAALPVLAVATWCGVWFAFERIEPPAVVGVANVEAVGVARAVAPMPGGALQRQPAVARQEPAPVAPRRGDHLDVHVMHEVEPKVQAGEVVGLVVEGEVTFAATDAAGVAHFANLHESELRVAHVSGTEASEPQSTYATTMDLVVPKGETVVVHVVDVGGHPVAGAEVEGNGCQCMDRLWWPLGRSDNNGELRLRDQSGRAQLRARAVGHGPSRFGNLEANGDDEARCELRLEAGTAPLRGRVVDENGKPVAAGLGVVAFASDVLEPWYEPTDAAGNFELAWLPPGHVGIVARRRDGDIVQRGMLRLEAPANAPVEVRLGRGASLTVTASTVDGGVAPGALVQGRLLADAVFRVPFGTFSATTDAHGNCACEGLLPGRWELTARIGDAEQRTVASLTAGETATWQPRAPALLSLLVRLVDEQGRALPGWRVGPCDVKNGRPMTSAWPTDADGRVWEHAHWSFPADTPLTLAVYDAAAYESDDFPVLQVPGIVPTGSEQTITVPDRCRTTHVVKGTIVDDDNQPLAATVYIASQRMPSDGKNAATAIDGTFALGPFAPGRLLLTVSAPGLPDLDHGAIDVPFGGDLELGTLQLGAAGAVIAKPKPGTVAPDDLRLQLVSRDGGRVVAVRKNERGELASEPVPCGAYVLRGAGSAVAVRELPVVVTRGNTAIGFEVVAAPTVHVTVMLEGDEVRCQQSWSGTIDITRDGGGPVLRRELSRTFAGHFVDSIGCDVALAEGLYTLQLRTWNRQSATAACTVTDDGAVVTLRPTVAGK